jgi:drug/metabolite transporter (DMT)-like permease
MSNNQQQNWKIGLSLSLMVVFFWSTLPVALNISLSAVDAWTLTWLRFCVAAVLTTIFILFTGSWKGFLSLSRANWLWLLLAGIMLTGNYVLFILGLERTTPGNAQVLIQLAPLLMIVGGIYFYKEKFYFKQKLGAVLLIAGLLLFFSEQLGVIVKPEYKSGAIIMVFAAITWAVYALIQKRLHDVLSSQAILAMIYIVSSLALLPSISPNKLMHLNQNQWLAVAYASLNTVGAYAAFTQALKYWAASRVGMVIAIIPVFTLLFINLMSRLFPQLVQPEHIQTLGFIGVILIVVGSMIASIGKN